jgi:hypothetical protein
VVESCTDILRRNPALNGTDGVYRINVGGETKEVFCDMTTQGGGWTVSTKKSDKGNIYISREVNLGLSHFCRVQIRFESLLISMFTFIVEWQ